MKDFLMGADPEMVCVYDGNHKYLYGSEFGDQTDKFGCDGNGDTFELRPDPEKEPLDLVQNIHTILNRAAFYNSKKLIKSNWHAGSCYGSYPLGGHIHFATSGLCKAYTVPQFVKILDNYLAPLVILLEEPNSAIKRRELGYGEFHNYRNQAYGFEYRMLSSWITSPYVASAVLCLAKVIVSEVINNSKFQPTYRLTGKELNPFELENQNKTKSTLWRELIIKIKDNKDEIFAEIKKMKLYKKYSHYINIIPNLIKNEKTWLTPDMKESWGIIYNETTIRRVGKKSNTLNEIWNDLIKVPA